MIIVRNDDILNNTSGKFKGKEFDRFRFIHKMIMETNGELRHQPAILCTEIEEYPEAIEYIRIETALGNMDPQLHGWEHKDYVHLDPYEICDMLEGSMEWFEGNLDTQYTVWATPWGGTDVQAVEVCESLGITLQTTDGTITPGTALHAAKTDQYDRIDGRTILHHWYDRGNNLFRLCEVLKHGSWEAAVEADERNWF